MPVERQTARKATFNYFIDALVMLFGIVSLVVVKRYMGYEVLGMLAYATAYVGLFQIISDMGLGIAHNKYANDKDFDFAKCNGTLIFLKFFLNISMVLIVLLSIVISKYFFDSPFGSSMLVIIVLLTLVRAFVENCTKIFKNINASKLLVAKNQIPRLTGRLFQMLMKCSIAIAGTYSAAYLVGAEIVTAVIILITILYISRSTPVARPSWRYITSFTKFGGLVVIIGLISTINHYIDRIMVETFLGIEEVGVYFLAFTMSNPLRVVAQVLLSILFVTFADYYSNGKMEKINKMANTAVKYISLITLPVVGLLLPFSRDLLILLFGDDAYRSVAVFQILLFAVFVYNITVPYSAQIISTGKLKIAFGISVFSLLAKVALNLVLIPDEIYGIRLLGFGVLGAAIATLIVACFRFVLCKYYVFLITRTRIYGRLWVHVFSNLTASLLVYNLLEILSYKLYYLPFFFLAYLGVWLIINLVWKEVKIKDIKLVVDTFSLKKMVSYVNSELRT